MSYTALKVENIGKQYAIGETVSEYDTLRDRIMETITKPFSKNKQVKERETFWALNDVNFSVQQGEVVGIIGRNGAGKSTLLKILSRITTPTSGRIRLRGRIGTLLEVGTGFHPELTGRENTYMNGAILGMTRSEISKKFDEIVEFSGVERFIDTPVKRYSSGMYVRLAFAVAAHLETDILLVDEVLAVGDFAFQQKCLGKMSDVAGAGRTVLFVSHNVGAVQDLCPRTILLENGSVAADDETNITLAHYIESLSNPASDIAIEHLPRDFDHLGNDVRIIDTKIYNSQNEQAQTLTRGEPFSIEITCRTNITLDKCSFLVGFNSVYDERLMTVTGFEGGNTFTAQQNQIVSGRLQIEHLGFTPGRYYLNVAVTHHSGQNLDRLSRVIGFDISDIQYDIEQKHYRNNGYIQMNNPEWQVKVVE